MTPEESQRLICDAFWDALAGTKFAEGAHRDVYGLWFDPKWVIKVEKNRAYFKNIQEWLTWRNVQDSTSAKYFAPCKSISADGTVLIQRRTEPLGPKESPGKILNWLGDVKRENFGWLDGKIVCHDYANIVNTTTNRMKKWKPHAES